MDMIFLFLAGIFGAFITAYLAKEEPIPEFRPFFDIGDKEKEAVSLQSRVSKSRQEIDDVQLSLTNDTGVITDGQRDSYKLFLETTTNEIAQITERLEKLESQIKRQQFNSRLSGLIAYIVIGGVLAMLLTPYVDVTVLEGKFSDIFESLAIGGTWTSYLSLFGLKSGQKAAQATMQAIQSDTTEKLNTLRNEVTKTFEMMPGMLPAGNTPATHLPENQEGVQPDQSQAQANAQALLKKMAKIEKEINDNMTFAKERVRRL